MMKFPELYDLNCLELERKLIDLEFEKKIWLHWYKFFRKYGHSYQEAKIMATKKSREK